MKLIHKQPYVSIRISPSFADQHHSPYNQGYKSKSKKRHKHLHESHCSSRSDHSKHKHHKLDKQPHSISSSQSKEQHSKVKYQHNVKPYIMDRQIKEEYNLDYHPSKHQHKRCPHSLEQCKYIGHYMCTIRDRLKQQKTKNSILKRRNRQLTQQNILFNEYFEVFEERYRNMKEDYEDRLSKQKNNQKNVTKNERQEVDCHSRSDNHSKSHHHHSHHNHQKTKKHNHKHSEGQSIYEYMGNRSSQYQHDINSKRYKLHSCVTSASSRHQSRQNFYFPSRFDERHSRGIEEIHGRRY